MSNQEVKKDTLVAMVPTQKDWLIVKNDNWYRIPVVSAPNIVKDSEAQYIAFYHPKVFREMPWSIKYYGKIERVEIKKRIELLPNETLHKRKDESYYQIYLKTIDECPNNIVSYKGRRTTFIATTYDKLINAKEYNDLFIGSYLEEIMWQALKEVKIHAEREYEVTLTNGKRYFIDFAIFCRKSNLAIECDGDQYHLKLEVVHRDKDRDRHLSELGGYETLRYYTKKICNEMSDVIEEISMAINNRGGLVKLHPNQVDYINIEDKKWQLTLFGNSQNKID
ncbi:MAG: endonuclease domain-containing protein [Bacteriodetes bacterium]|nr:endonuclease domain-containing protein [Bacteroidota bacterium]